MKKIITLLLILAMSVVFFGCGNKTDFNAIKDSGKLIVGVTYYEPMCYYNDAKELVGFDTEFIKAVCTKLDITPTFQEIEWEQKEAMLKAGNIDCIWNGLTVTEERRENMDFSDTYLVNEQVVVIDKKNAATFTSTASLSSKTFSVSAESGSSGNGVISDDENLKKATFSGFPSQVNALLAVASGNADAAVVDYTTAKATCGNGEYTDLVIVDTIEFPKEYYAIGFRLGSDMTAEVNKIITDMVADGSLKAIADKYGLTDLYERNFNVVK